MKEYQIQELKTEVLRIFKMGTYHPHGSNGGSKVYCHVYIHGIEVWATIDTQYDNARQAVTDLKIKSNEG
jgi:gamma-glutamylcyclotransferase (GGCT)/AIG2-like uncharacterized protein YtfP